MGELVIEAKHSIQKIVQDCKHLELVVQQAEEEQWQKVRALLGLRDLDTFDLLEREKIVSSNHSLLVYFASKPPYSFHLSSEIPTCDPQTLIDAATSSFLTTNRFHYPSL